MRLFGIDERYITGNATDKEKFFFNGRKQLPYTVRNRYNHWTHLELTALFWDSRVVGAREWRKKFMKRTSAMYSKHPRSYLELLQQQKVESLCTARMKP